MNDNNNDDDLPALRAPSSGRRTDDAFFRSVKDGVQEKKKAPALWFAAPALAAAATLALVVVVGRDPAPAVIGASTLLALAEEDVVFDAFVDVDDLDDDTLIALADEDAGDGVFAIEALDGSSDRELNDVEEALDRALKL